MVLAGIAASLALAGTAVAAPGLKLDKQGISAKQCLLAGLHPKQVVNVHYRILNDADSGFAGNYWANDTIDRHVRIWAEQDGTYCVQVADHGSFVTYAGASPGGTGMVSAGVQGQIEGGYITSSVAGTFAPTLPTHGNLGTYDVQCDSSGNCPGTTVSWASYFSSIASADSFAHWGWIYRAGEHGTWLNQDDVTAANSGDITG